MAMFWAPRRRPEGKSQLHQCFRWATKQVSYVIFEDGGKPPSFFLLTKIVSDPDRFCHWPRKQRSSTGSNSTEWAILGRRLSNFFLAWILFCSLPRNRMPQRGES